MKLRGLKNFIIFYSVALIIYVITQSIFSSGVTPNSIEVLKENYGIESALSEKDALNILNTNEIVNVVENEGQIIFKTADNEFFLTTSTESVEMALELAGVTSTETTATNSVLDALSSLIVPIFIVICVFSLLKMLFAMWREKKVIDTAEDLTYRFSGVYDGGIGDIPNEKAKSSKEDKGEIFDNDKKITFDDVQGIDELKPDLYRLVDCLKNPKKYKELGARMPKGLVLYGPPGTGKTLTAKAIAGEAGVPFFSMCGSDFVEKYVGVGASRVRELYKKARKVAPAIVFIDEIDAIGGGRGESNNGEKDQTINALLAELDGFNSSNNILTICATNRLDILDPALLRAGRFDLKLAVGLPDKDGREAILKLHSKNKKLDDSVSIEGLAKKTIGFSGAELENLLNEGALIAANNNGKVITNEDLENAFFKIIMDGNKKPRKEKDDETYLTAWHEAGHTLATKLLTKDGVPTVTIIQSTSGAGGVTFMAPDEKNLPSKKYLRNKIKIDYAGRAAEEIYLGNSDDITTGASQDIKDATSVIKAYIGAYGMGSKGLIDIKQLTTQYDIVEEAGKLSTILYQETLDLLKSNKDKLELLANALVEKETLYEDEIDDILGIKKEEKISFSKEEVVEVEA